MIPSLGSGASSCLIVLVDDGFGCLGLVDDRSRLWGGVEQPLWQNGKSGGSKKSIVTLRLLSKKGCKKKDHGLPYLHILFDMLIG